MQIRKILLPVDGSDHSLRATEEAIEFAKHFDAEILLLHCNEVFPNLKPHGDYSREVTQYANKILGPSRDLLQDNNIRYMERVMDGSPTQEIPEIAEREAVDLIVMGTRGANPLETLLLGSVTQRVLKLSKCRVLVVK